MLRRTQTKESIGAPLPEDIERLKKVYRDAHGQMDRLARTVGASISLIRKNLPKDAEDFAVRMLKGEFTGDTTAIAKQELRDRLREDIQDSASKLKRTSTKESIGPSPVELAAVAEFYESHQGNLDEIAEACGISVALLKNNAPQDAQEFAERLLQGGYSEETAEKAKADLREKLLEQILRRKSTLKRTSTKENVVLSDMEIEFVAKVWTSNNGDLKKIAQQCNCDLHLLQAKPPTDPKEFAQRLFDGDFSANKDAENQRKLRQGLRNDLLRQVNQLKPAVVQQKNRSVSTADIDKYKMDFDCDHSVAGIELPHGQKPSCTAMGRKRSMPSR